MPQFPEWVWIVLILVALVVGAVGAWFYLQRRRSRELSQRFGPEYERTVQEYGDQRHAEVVLEARQKRVERFEIHHLSVADRAQFQETWRSVQTRFVDDPNGAIADADRLIGHVMQVRGYPVGDFEQRVADISVAHPNLVGHYREAQEVALRKERGEATTEHLRQAMVHYRALFEELLETREPEQKEERRGRAA